MYKNVLQRRLHFQKKEAQEVKVLFVIEEEG